MRRSPRAVRALRALKSTAALSAAVAAALGNSVFSSPARAANTEVDVTGTAANTPLDSAASYNNSGSLPNNSNDVTFTSGTGYAGSFTLTTAGITVGSLNDLNLTPLTITGTQTLTLSGGGDAVANGNGGNTADLLFVAAGGSLSLNAPVALAAASGNAGNFDAAATATLSVGGVVSGGSGITLNGGGAVTLSGANTYSGGTTLAAGTLGVGNNSALGTGALTVTGAGAVIQAVGGPISVANTLSANADFTFGGTSALTFTNTTTLSANRTLAFTNTALTTLGAVAGTNTNLTITGAGSEAISGVIGTGTGSLTMSGTGVLTLGGTNTYTGTTAINAGTVSISNNLNLGAAAAPVSLNGGTLKTTAGVTDTHVITVGASGGTFNVNGGQLYFHTASTLIGSGALTVTGAGGVNGNIRVDTAQTYSGTVTLGAGGSIEYNAANVFPTTTGFVVNGTGDGVQATSGELIVTAANTLANAVTVNGGILSADNNTGSVYSGAITLGSGGAQLATRDFYTVTNTGRNFTMSGAVSGTGGLTKSNFAGTVTLTGANTYTGPTAVNGGTLALGTGGSLAGTAVTVGGGAAATLQARGNYTIGTSGSGSVALTANTGTLSLVDGTINTLTINNATSNATALTLGGGTNLNFETSTTTADALTLGGPTLAASVTGLNTINLTILNRPTANQTYTLIAAPGGGLGSNTNFKLGTISGPTLTGVNYSLNVNAAGTALQLIAALTANSPGVAYFNGQTDTSWNTLTAATPPATNFTSDAAGTTNTQQVPAQNTDVFYTSNNARNFASSALNGAFVINSLTLGAGSASGQAVTIAPGTGGSLTINAAATSNATTYQANGTNVSSTGNPAGNGILVVPGAGAVTISAPVTLGAAQTWTNNSSNTLTLTGGVTAGANLLTFAGPGATTVSGTTAFTTSAGATVNAGAGAVTISAPVTLGGASTFTNNSSNVLNLGAVAAGGNALNVAGTGGTTLASATSTGAINLSQNGTVSIPGTLNGGTSSVLTTSGTNGRLALSSTSTTANTLKTLQMNAANGVVDIGAGTLTLSNSGSSTIQSATGGTINATGGGSLKISSNTYPNFGDNGTVGGTTLTINAKIASNGSAATTDGFEVYGGGNTAGTVILTGQNSFTGDVNIDGGTLQVPAVGNTGSTTSPLGAGTNILISGAGNNGLRYTGPGETTNRVINLNGTNNGGGFIDQSGTGTLRFSAPVANSNATAAKTLTLQGSTTGVGEIDGAIPNGASTNTTLVTKQGTGTWVLGGANTYTGATAVNGGALLLTTGGSLAATPVTVASGATFGVRQTASGTSNAAAGNLTLSAGANLSMADGATSTLSVGGTGSLAGGTLAFDIGGATTTAADLLAITGAGTATSTESVTINSIPGSAAATGTSFVLITAGSGTLNGATYTLTNGGRILLGGTAYQGSLSATTTALTLNLTSSSTSPTPSAYFNGAGGTTALNAPNGTTGATNFSSDSAGQTDFGGQPGPLQDVYFTATNLSSPATPSLTIASLGQAYTWNTLNFTSNAPATTINNSPAFALTVNNGITNASSNNQTVNVPVILGGPQTITNTGTGLLTLGGGLTGAGNLLTFAGSGPTTISGTTAFTTNVGATVNAGAGAVTISAPVTLGGASTFTNNSSNALSLGAVTLGANTLTVGGSGPTTLSGNIGGTGGVAMAGTGTLTLSGTNAYTGATTLSAGTTKLGGATALNNTSALSMSGAATLDLNGFNGSVTNVAASATTNTITNNGSTNAALTVSNFSTSISAALKDGPTNTLGLVFSNNNSSVTLIPTTAQNTFSGGLTLANSTNGTRLRISTAVTFSGTPGALVSGPYGTGPINVGVNTTDKAGLLLDTVTNITVPNAIVVNTSLGTDAPAAIRLDTTGNVFSGTITANKAAANFIAGAAATSTNVGAASLTGRVTGPFGLTLNNLATATGALTITLANATATPNDYKGDTTIGTASAVRNTLALGANEQIPNGSGFGNVNNFGTLNMAGFSETINGLTGSGTVDNLASAASTLTIGDNNATSTFGGTIKSTTGPLSVAKIGSGTLTLTGANTYTGSTAVNAGALLVNGSLAGGVSVSGGTLGGTGSIAGPATVALGSTLSPSAGGATPHVLTVGSGTGASALSFATPTPTATSNYQVLITGAGDTGATPANAGVNYDSVKNGNTSGTALPLNGANLVLLDNLTASGTYDIVQNARDDGVTAGQFFTFGGASLTNGTKFLGGSNPFTIVYNSDPAGDGTGTGSDIVLVSSTPEPASLALLGLGALGLLARRRRRAAGRA